MGFTPFGNAGPSLRPTTTGRNRAVTTNITVPGYEVETPVFGTAQQIAVTGEAFPRLALYAGSFNAGAGAAAPNVGLGYVGPPSGAVAGTLGTWAHRGLRPADLDWRNVKHWGATGDGSTDDMAAIQACIDAGGGTVYIPQGTYMISGSLSIPSNIYLRGAGMFRSTLKATAASTVTMIKSSGIAGWTTSTSVNWVQISDLTLDGNKAARAASTGGQHGIWFRGPNGAGCSKLSFERLRIIEIPTFGIALQNVTEAQVSNCQLVNCGRDGISFWGTCVWVAIADNLVQGSGDDHIALNAVRKDADGVTNLFADMRDITITGNVCGPASDTGPFGNGIAVSGARRVAITGNAIFSQLGEGIIVRTWNSSETAKNSAGDITIVGNTIVNAGQPTFHPAAGNGQGITLGIGVPHEFEGTDPGGPTGSISRTLIAQNVILGSRGHAIWVNGSTSSGVIDNIQILGNIIRGGSGQDADSSGIVVGGSGAVTPRSGHYSAADVAVTDVTIANNKVSHSPNYGIYVNGANVARLSVLNNEVFQNGLQTASPGIALLALTDYRCSGNRSKNNSGSGQTYGIALTGGAGTNWVNANMLNGNATGALQRNSLTGTNRIWHNEGDTVAATPPPF